MKKLAMYFCIGIWTCVCGILAHADTISLADALDTTGISWTTGGNASWFGQNTTYYYNNDAARSGAILNSQSTYMQGVVTGPATLSFYWKVSSESGYDYLRFLIDGSLKDSISGDVQWTQKTYLVAGGTHTVRWEYKKDGSVSNGADAGWVDYVVLSGTTNPHPPELLWTGSSGYEQDGVNPDRGSGTFTFRVKYKDLNGNAPKTGYPKVHILKTGVEISSATMIDSYSGTYSTGREYYYECNFSTAGTDYSYYFEAYDSLYENAATGEPTQIHTGPEVISLADALDTIGITWTTGGNALWFTQDTTYYYNNAAAQSGIISSFGSSYLQAVVTGPVILSFYWKISSDSGNYLKFLLDGNEKTSISGEKNWEQKQYVIPSGTHTVKWIYQKDYTSGRTIPEKGWLDYVVLSGTENVRAPELIWTGSNGYEQDGVDPDRGFKTFVFSVKYKSINGYAPKTGYPKLHLLKAGVEISSVTMTDSYSGTYTTGREYYYSCNLSTVGADYSYYFEAYDNLFENAAIGEPTQIHTGPELMSLGDALDTTGIVWTTGGDASWYGQNTTYYYNNAAARSGTVDWIESSYLQTVVTGPVVLSFYWKVSSKYNSDYLKFLFDGNIQNSISGEVNWTQKQYVIPSGIHTVKWIYQRGYNYPSGADAGWVDYVVVSTTNPHPPELLWTGSSGYEQDGVNPDRGGGTFTFRVKYKDLNGNVPKTGYPKVHILKAGVEISSATMIDSSSGTYSTGREYYYACNLSTVGTDYSYYFEAYDSVFNTAATGEPTQIHTGPEVISLADALDTTGIVWTTGGDASWYGQNTTYYYNNAAARSGAIGSYGSSYLQTVVTGPVVLSFYWKVSSYSYNYLKFSLDGSVKNSISGEVNWTQKQYVIQSGTHTVKWTYQKDSSYASGADAGWLDYVVVSTTNPHPPELSWTGSSGYEQDGVNPDRGGAFTFRVKYKDLNGNAPKTGYPKLHILKAGVEISSATMIDSSSGTYTTGREYYYSCNLSTRGTGGTDYSYYFEAYDSIFNSAASGEPTQIHTGPEVISLAEAVDITGITWTTGGDALWYGQGTTSYYNNDAAQSGAMSSYGNSYLQTVVTGPVVLSFYWKVSSHSYNSLRCCLDGYTIGSISGEKNWTQQQYVIPSGTHTVQWTYQKNYSYIYGADAGWVDYVVITTTQNPVALLWTGSSGYEQDGVNPDRGGGGFTFRVKYKDLNGNGPTTGYPKLHLLKGGVHIATATMTDAWSGTYSTGQEYYYSCNLSTTGTDYSYYFEAYDRVYNSAAIGEPTQIHTGPEVRIIPISDALDTTGIVWTTGGDTSWFGQDTTYYYNNAAAQSGVIGDNQSTYMQTVVTGPVILSFYWKVSSYYFNYLEFSFDGSEKKSISGEVNWAQQQYIIPTGTHTIKWIYQKNSDYVRSGADAGWVDYVVISATSTYPTELLWQGSYGYEHDGVNPDRGGGTFTFRVKYKDLNGSAPKTGYPKLHLLKGGVEISSATMNDAYSGTYTTGREYYYSCNLSTAGTDYSYYFEAYDSIFNSTATGEPTQIHTGPEVRIIPISDVLDTTNIVWTTGGNASWYGQDTTYYYNNAAAQSGAIDSYGGTCYLQTVVTGPVVLSFYWKVSSEARYDYLKFLLDGNIRDSISGSIDWTQKQYMVSSGTHTLRWEYTKDGSVSSGADAGWLDYVVLAELQPPRLSWVGEGSYETTGVNPQKGNNQTPFTFRVKYISTCNLAPLSGYPKLHVRKGTTEISGSPFTMSAYTSTPYTQGRVYTCTQTLPNGWSYNYYFEASDVFGNAAIGNAVQPHYDLSLLFGSGDNVYIVGGQNGYVNPNAGDTANIIFTPSQTGDVEIKIYTRDWQLVWETKKLVTADVQESILWNCTNTDGATVASGIYIVCINGAGIQEKKKCAVVR